MVLNQITDLQEIADKMDLALTAQEENGNRSGTEEYTDEHTEGVPTTSSPQLEGLGV